MKAVAIAGMMKREVMTGDQEPLKERQRFEVGDEVIGDDHIRGRITRIEDVRQAAVAGRAATVREYLIKDENGGRFLYAGEVNLRLIKKGMGDASPPRPELLLELEEDLRNRPLIGLRL